MSKFNQNCKNNGLLFHLKIQIFICYMFYPIWKFFYVLMSHGSSLSSVVMLGYQENNLSRMITQSFNVLFMFFEAIFDELWLRFRIKWKSPQNVLVVKSLILSSWKKLIIVSNQSSLEIFEVFQFFFICCKTPKLSSRSA